MKATHLTTAIALLLVVGATHAASETPQQTPEAYAGPGKQVVIAGDRKLNLRCSGHGARTVVLEAGANADSSTWFRVQPLLQDTRVCAYDRAGYGFSDEGPRPRGLEADVADLHALLAAAKLPAPVVLVGHSLGSNIVRRYAQAYPDEVAGLVLVDPPEQGAQAQMPEQWKRDDEAMSAKRNAFLDACEQGAAAGTLDAAEGPLQACLRDPPPWQSTQVAKAIRGYKLKPGYWRTLRSELTENQAIFAAPVPQDESYGAIPVRVLTAPNDDPDVPDEVRQVMQQARGQTRARLVAASSHGRLIPVKDTSHDIQLDQPQAVADAVLELLESTAPGK